MGQSPNHIEGNMIIPPTNAPFLAHLRNLQLMTTEMSFGWQIE